MWHRRLPILKEPNRQVLCPLSRLSADVPQRLLTIDDPRVVFLVDQLTTTEPLSVRGVVKLIQKDLEGDLQMKDQNAMICAMSGIEWAAKVDLVSSVHTSCALLS